MPKVALEAGAMEVGNGVVMSCADKWLREEDALEETEIEASV